MNIAKALLLMSKDKEMLLDFFNSSDYDEPVIIKYTYKTPDSNYVNVQYDDRQTLAEIIVRYLPAEDIKTYLDCCTAKGIILNRISLKNSSSDGTNFLNLLIQKGNPELIEYYFKKATEHLEQWDKNNPTNPDSSVWQLQQLFNIPLFNTLSNTSNKLEAQTVEQIFNILHKNLSELHALMMYNMFRDKDQQGQFKTFNDIVKLKGKNKVYNKNIKPYHNYSDLSKDFENSITHCVHLYKNDNNKTLSEGVKAYIKMALNIDRKYSLDALSTLIYWTAQLEQIWDDISTDKTQAKFGNQENIYTHRGSNIENLTHALDGKSEEFINKHIAWFTFLMTKDLLPQFTSEVIAMYVTDNNRFKLNTQEITTKIEGIFMLEPNKTITLNADTVGYYTNWLLTARGLDLNTINTWQNTTQGHNLRKIISNTAIANLCLREDKPQEEQIKDIQTIDNNLATIAKETKLITKKDITKIYSEVMGSVSDSAKTLIEAALIGSTMTKSNIGKPKKDIVNKPTLKV